MFAFASTFTTPVSRSSIVPGTGSSSLGSDGSYFVSARRISCWKHPRRVSAIPSMSLRPSEAFTNLILSDVSDVNRGPLFATAFVFFLTFWGGISFVKGSTKPRITQASFTLRESASDIAKKTARYLMQRSFVADPEKDSRAGVMTFTGKVRASSSVASILVGVAASGLWSLTYILNFVLPNQYQSPYWGSLTLLSFLVVPWYWKAASRTEEVKVMVEEDEGVSTLYLKGHRDEIEQLEKAFNWKRNPPVYEGDEEQAETQKETVVSS
ncbi:unnamed protein product [Agarophyton chilense]